jgi:hypothetical protein
MTGGSLILALFSDADDAANAVHGLRAAGVADEDLHVLSGVPFPDETFKERPPLVPLQWLTLLGGFLGAIAGLLLAGGTAVMTKILTGHMNIVAAPPVGIITYEVMMLGAVVFTITGLALGLRKGRPKVDEPRLGEGYIGIVAPQMHGTRIAELLEASGAVEIRPLAEEG